MKTMSYPNGPPFPLQSNSEKQWEKIEDGIASSNELECEIPKLELLPQTMVGPHPVIWGRSLRNGVAPTEKKPRVQQQPEEYSDIELCHSSSPNTGENCDSFGRAVAAQLKHMSHMQRCVAQRLMWEICFRGQMQILTLNTTLDTHSDTYQQQQPAPQRGTFYPPRNGTPR